MDSTSFLYVEVIDGVRGEHELPLKERGWDVGPSDVTVFGVDAQDQNELSASEEVASGKVTIVEATCDPAPHLSFTISATLDSEYGDMPTVHVSGGLESIRKP